MYTFIVRPFGIKEDIDFERVDRELIQPALRSMGIRGETTVALTEAGNIREDMFTKLLTADLVIADISIHNANVFYELGIRHALRDRKTLLIRCHDGGTKDVPFDLKTDRYVTYSLKALKADSLRLRQAIEETQHSSRNDSPVFSLLPHLKAQQTEQFLVAPASFCREVSEARLNHHEGKLALLAAETRNFPWELSGLRMVGQIQYEMNSLKAARITWERIRSLVPDDDQVHDRLSAIYQMLAETCTHESHSESMLVTKLLSLSDLAINRVLSNSELSFRKRSEVYTLKARNYKFRWVNDWRSHPPENYRLEAIKSSYLLRTYEAYYQAFIEDLNHYQAGINALSLLTVILHLATDFPGEWEEHFDDLPEAELTLHSFRKKYEELVLLANASLEAARQRQYKSDEKDAWLEMTQADFRCLTLNKPHRILRLYQEILSNAEALFAHATWMQLDIYQKLQIRTDILAPVLEKLAPPHLPLYPSRPTCLLFTGLPLHRNAHCNHFPPHVEAKIRAKLQTQIQLIQHRTTGPLIGLAGGASGGDILFHELCKEADIPSRLFLTTTKNQYMKEFVRPAGADWALRFDAIYHQLSQAQNYQIRIISTNHKMPYWLHSRKNYTLWERTNLWMLYHAIAYSGQPPILISLWDGKFGSGPGSPVDLLMRMEQYDGEIIQINPNELCFNE